MTFSLRWFRYFNSVIRDEPEAIDAVSEEEKITISLLIHEAYASFDISSQDIEKLRYSWDK
jgi:hypothetical protein